MAVKVAINGFGRIGRNLFRCALAHHDIEFVAINDLTDAKTLAHLLKYDSVHGVLDAMIEVRDRTIRVNGRSVEVLAEKEPTKLPWKQMGVDIVVESTGRFTDRAGASQHLTAGARKVIISAPAKDPDLTVVIGVNETMYDPAKHAVLSNASCTTNCLAPVAKVLLDRFGIKRGLMTTIHSITNDQRLLDLPHKDLRRARAAGVSMIPTTTGAAKALFLVLPQLKGKMDGMAIRVPTPNVSVVDLVAELERDVTEAEVLAAYREAAEGDLKGILAYTEEPLVSIDLNDNPHSAILDATLTKVLQGRMVKVVAWYDNEWAYSCRIRDLIQYMASRGGRP
jgi:glyceraldehyde 3-phosphate dehydrogenase